MWSTQKIRQTFLEYFKELGHEIVPSSPLVPQNDPTLLFTAAGMVQFKNVFTGLEKRPYTRAVSSQKCVRAGGKHNDLENVGYTARHHTFFEMLGNFSFGDYFKVDAIPYAWNLVTKVFGIDPKRLVITVYVDDDEAASIWKKVSGFKDDQIIRIATSDNFWAMGDTGPCGPCSEIFYDHGAHIPGGPPGSPDQDGDRFVEIWNLVFMQYEQLSLDERINLPKPSIDTGAGIERLAAVLQGVHDNYDIDIFRTLIEASQDITGDGSKNNVSHRVIADHLRASCFLIADGVSPSNEGRGYVLRRIMRRAMRHAYLLGAKDPLMYQLVPVLVSLMGDAYSELGRAQALMTETLKLEEERFRLTLGRGLKLLEDELEKLSSSQSLSGDVAFKLYDTYGFPLDLTQDILRGQGRQVDTATFNQAMDRQKEEARKSWVGSGQTAEDKVWLEMANELPATEFLGYATNEAQGEILALLTDGNPVSKATQDQDILFITNQTPFYAESGGQIGDTGVAQSQSGAQLQITDCVKKAGKFHVHLATVISGEVSVGEQLTLTVDGDRRTLLRANHSATHLLHTALRRLLGEQVIQKGSLVAPDRLRFDFSYNQPLTSEQLRRVELEVNYLIRRNNATQTHLMTPDDALKTGAIALFGEKYGEEVRVVYTGESLEDEQKPYSVEFCGGTHVHRTGDIGYFKIIAETGVAAGIRRIEALTGPAAEVYAENRNQIVENTAQLLKINPEQVPDRVKSLLGERKEFEREIKALKEKLVRGETSTTAIKNVGSIPFLAKTLEGALPKDLKPMADQLRQQYSSAVIVLGILTEGKGSLVVSVSDDLTAKISAVDLVRIGSEALGGKGGGGRPDMAQAGGPDGDKLDHAYQKIEEHLSRLAL
jgi:alanyl-tRNA synthetase